MAGSGVTATNALQLAMTGVDALHFSAKKMMPGRMTYRNPLIAMGGDTSMDEYALRGVDEKEVKSIIELIHQL
jgi:copper homeostasis protein